MAVRGKRNGELRPPSTKGKNGEADAERQLDKGEVPAERESNVVKLTEDQIFSLLASQYRPMFKGSLKAKQDADKEAKTKASEHKTTCKKIIAEMGDDAVEKIRDMIKLDEEGGEEKMRAVIARQLWVAQYMASPLGTQFGMNLDVDRTPAVETAAKIGRADGLAGKRYDPSRYGQGTEQLAAYDAAFYVAQEEQIRAKLLPLESPPPIGDPPPAVEAAEEAPPPQEFTAGEQPNP